MLVFGRIEIETLGNIEQIARRSLPFIYAKGPAQRGAYRRIDLVEIAAQARRERLPVAFADISRGIGKLLNLVG